MKIIALSAWKQSGKDTVADYLIKEHGFIRFGFADVLKDMVAEQYDIPREYCDDVKFKEKALYKYPVAPKDKFSMKITEILQNEFRTLDGYSPEFIDDKGQLTVRINGEEKHDFYWTPRALCILEGSIKRSVNSNYWVQRVVDKIRLAASINVTGDYLGNYVISDLRYRSEVEALKTAFGNHLQVIRINRHSSINTTDPSERDLDDYNFANVLENKGSLEELYSKVDSLV